MSELDRDTALDTPTANPRRTDAIDDLIGQVDIALKSILGGMAVAGRAVPDGTETDLDAGARRESARLMRVNHCGEVCAQALYQGQALTARNGTVRDHLLQAGREEQEHLHWCETRIKELGGRVSHLNGLFYLASFGAGALAGALGDRVSLGFINATEDLVCDHLQRHLDRLPAEDLRSRAILEQMKQDEGSHAAEAIEAGGRSFGRTPRRLMERISRIMTGSTYWI